MELRQIEEGLELIVQFKKRGGLIPSIVQNYTTGVILMLGYVNREAFDETLRSGYATFWSTSRNKLWKKGEISGNYLEVQEILVDCDQDALVMKVKTLGNGACHVQTNEGETRKSCFYRRIADSRLEYLDDVK